MKVKMLKTFPGQDQAPITNERMPVKTYVADKEYDVNPLFAEVIIEGKLAVEVAVKKAPVKKAPSKKGK